MIMATVLLRSARPAARHAAQIPDIPEPGPRAMDETYEIGEFTTAAVNDSPPHFCQAPQRNPS